MKYWIIIIILILGCISDKQTSSEEIVNGILETNNSKITQILSTSTTMPYFDLEKLKMRKISSLGFTHNNPFGNHFVSGSIDLANSKKAIIELDLYPSWVVCTKFGNSTFWAVRLENGTMQTFKFEGGNATEIELLYSNTMPMSPPLLGVYDDGTVSLISHNGYRANPFTHPIPYKNFTFGFTGERVLYGIIGYDIPILYDARILTDGETILMLSQPTDEYGHGILGDGFEAKGFTILNSTSKKSFTLTDGVVEGLFPIWADFNGDTEKEIILTVSNQLGARYVVVSENLSIISTSKPIGFRNRWRHQIAVAPLGPKGELELVGVRTPHMGGIVEYFQITNDSLTQVAELGGYSSHWIGDRNLDMALVGDFNNDGQNELLVPTDSYEHLGVLKRTSSGATEIGRIRVAGILMTNIAALDYEGKMMVGYGNRNKKLVIHY